MPKINKSKKGWVVVNRSGAMLLWGVGETPGEAKRALMRFFRDGVGGKSNWDDYAAQGRHVVPVTITFDEEVDAKNP